MIGALAALAALAVVAMAVAVSLLGWGGKVGTAQRLGLCLMTAGLVWAAPARFLGHAASLGDLAFLIGLGLYIWSIHGPEIWRSLDGLDGVRDGWIGSALDRSPGAARRVVGRPVYDPRGPHD